jgi:hypothetical protein
MISLKEQNAILIMATVLGKQSVGITGFLDFVHRPVFKTRRFRNWISFSHQVNG